MNSRRYPTLLVAAGAAVTLLLASCGSDAAPTGGSSGAGPDTATGSAAADTGGATDTGGSTGGTSSAEQPSSGAGSGTETSTGPAEGSSAAVPVVVKGGPLEIGVLTAANTPGLKFLQGVADQMEKDIPGTKITFTFANTQARPAMEQRWRSGSGPDVDYGMFDGTNPALLDWANEGFLEDLTPYLQQKDPATGKTWQDRVSPSVLKFMQHPESKKIYGVPTELSAEVLFYNKKVFDSLNLKPPTTWDELLADVDGLKAGNVDPIAVTGLFEPYMGMWTDYLWDRMVGYDSARKVLTDGQGAITDDPGFLDGLKKIQELRDKGAFLKGFEGTEFTAAQAQFFQGKAGMILMGSWLVSEMKSVIPKDFELGVVPFPAVTGGKGDPASLLGKTQSVSVNAKSKNIPLAVEWVKRLTSAKVQAERADQTGELSAFLDVPAPAGLPGIDKIVAGTGSVDPAYYSLPESEAKDAVYPEVAKLFFGKQDPDATLEAIDGNLKDVYGN